MAEPVEGQFDQFDYLPVPGTFNLEVKPAVRDAVGRWPSVEERSRHGTFRFHPVWVDGHAAHISRRGKHLEVAAPFSFRESFGLKDGDMVTFGPRPIVSVTVMAHPKRERWAVDLAGRLGCGIVWDEKNEVWDTARRAWLAHDLKATHHLVVQDDVVVCRNLTEALPDIVRWHPHNPVSLISVDYRFAAKGLQRYRKHVAQGRNWFSSLRGLPGCAVILPVADIPNVVKRGDRHKSPHDDVKIMHYYRQRRMPAWFVIPSLVQHRTDHNPTLVDGNDDIPDRFASQWVGEDWDALSGDWTPKGP